MRDRLKGLKRIVEVQRHLHSLEEVKYARLQQKLAECRNMQAELTEALSTDEALRGLFVDMTVRRIKSLRQEEAALIPQIEAQARVMIQQGGRLRNAERLAEDVDVDVQRIEEREELDRLLEAAFARDLASSEQDG